MSTEERHPLLRALFLAAYLQILDSGAHTEVWQPHSDQPPEGLLSLVSVPYVSQSSENPLWK